MTSLTRETRTCSCVRGECTNRVRLEALSSFRIINKHWTLNGKRVIFSFSIVHSNIASSDDESDSKQNEIKACVRVAEVCLANEFAGWYLNRATVVSCGRTGWVTSVDVKVTLAPTHVRASFWRFRVARVLANEFECVVFPLYWQIDNQIVLR